AALLSDGQQLNIPYKSGQAPVEDAALLELPGSPGTDDFPSATAEPSNSNTDTELININTAALEDLDSLPGIGPTNAQRIIDYRTENGPFSTIEEIMDVSGVGPATFDEIKDLITV
ncbi:MAG: helix-hairpin-helix domain-containing protein, partial [Anaerolineales bacterium]|nr:helix-hairpin-helix domain-containing protein [Anaerolineales bacterium]